MYFSLGGNQANPAGQTHRGEDTDNEFGKRSSFRGNSRGRSSFRGGFRVRGSFRGVHRGRGSFRGVHRGRGSFRGEHRGRGSFRGEHRGRGSYGGEHRGRGSYGGEHRGRGSYGGEHRGRGSYGGEHRGRGSYGGEHGGRGSSHSKHGSRGSEADDTIKRRLSRLGFIFVEEDESRRSFVRKRLREDEKVKHLFEDLRSDSFPNKLKTFNNLSLPEAIKIVSIGVISGNPKQRLYNIKVIKEAIENLPPPTLRDAINVAKYQILNSSREGFIDEINDRHFPRKVPYFGQVALKEMKDLSGVDPLYSRVDVLRVLSHTGWIIVKGRFWDYVYNIHQRAADYIVQHPEVCKNISLGTLEL